jgi:hypothetical protein
MSKNLCGEVYPFAFGLSEDAAAPISWRAAARERPLAADASPAAPSSAPLRGSVGGSVVGLPRAADGAAPREHGFSAPLPPSPIAKVK